MHIKNTFPLGPAMLLTRLATRELPARETEVPTTVALPGAPHELAPFEVTATKNTTSEADKPLPETVRGPDVGVVRQIGETDVADAICN